MKKQWWLPFDVERQRQLAKEQQPPKDDGGGNGRGKVVNAMVMALG